MGTTTNSCTLLFLLSIEKPFQFLRYYRRLVGCADSFKMFLADKSGYDGGLSQVQFLEFDRNWFDAEMLPIEFARLPNFRFSTITRCCDFIIYLPGRHDMGWMMLDKWYSTETLF